MRKLYIIGLCLSLMASSLYAGTTTSATGGAVRGIQPVAVNKEVYQQGFTTKFQVCGDLILKPDGTLWATGDNTNGRLSSQVKEKFISRPIKIMDNVKHISGKAYVTDPSEPYRFAHSGFIITEDNTLWELRDSLTKLMENVIYIGGNSFVKADGSLYVMGYIDDNMATIFNITAGDNVPPIKVMSGVKQAKLESYTFREEYTFMILKTDGSLIGCGSNKVGSLGDGTTVEKKSFVPIMKNVKEISSTGDTTFVIKNDNTLWGWGYNGFGAIGGFGNSKNQNITTKPVQILTNVKKAHVSFMDCVVLKNDNTLWAWGCNQFTGFVQPPTEKSTNVTKIASAIQDFEMGSFRLAAIKTNGSVWMYGENFADESFSALTGKPNKNIGYFGTKNKTQIGQFASATLLEGVIGIGVHDLGTNGGMGTYALKADGSVFAWGTKFVILGNDGEPKEETLLPNTFINAGWEINKKDN